LVVAVVLMIGLGAVISAVTANQYSSFSRSDLLSFNPVTTSLDGVNFAVLAFGVLGVLLFSGEYSTGMIRSSLTVVPGRLPVLWGKLVIFASVVFSVSAVASFISFYLGQALLSSKGLDVSITSPGALRSVIGAALFMTVAGLIGVSLGALLRNTAGGITTFVGAFFVVPPLTGLLPSAVSNHLTQYLPSNAGAALYGGTHGVDHALSPWTGFAVLCVYAVVLIGAAAYRLRRVDA
jgi:ABC-2 type transport system permease protein